MHPCTSVEKQREADWSPVIGGVKELAWADETWSKLMKYASGYYTVQNHPGTRFYQEELSLAFGAELPRLHLHKSVWDPLKKFHPP
jgi:hypothetical protein